MKKTVVVIILAVYIASIAVVNFFGLEIKQYDGETYIGSIEPANYMLFLGNNNEELPAYDSGDGSGTYIYYFDFIPPAEGGVYDMEDANNHNMIRLVYTLRSEEGVTMALDDGMIEYLYDKESGDIFFHEATGSFVFLKPGLVDITIKATDGHNAKTKVYIMAKEASVATN